MATTRISDFFNGKFFEIPKYQRGYAWDLQNINDLFDDINESVVSNSNHYIGTIVLSKDKHNPDKFYIVDGQQRITTISMIIQSLVNNLDENNKLFYERFYIKEDDEYRLKPLNRDGKYFTSILSGNILDPENKNQRALKDAMERINLKVQNIDNKLSFLKSIEKLQIMEFIENTEGDAIRIFQTVNDRGKLLSNMEKAKSLLIYFSNRYIDGILDETISEDFSEIFEVYDDLKKLGEQLNITIIKNKVFSEDTIMSYHFISFSSENYAPTPEYVLQHLKNNLQGKRSSPNELKDFITNYVLSLKDFFNAAKSLLLKANIDAKYYKLFSILQVSATLYPLIINLEVIRKLDEIVQITDKKNVSFFDLIELIDVRVYKTRGTDPKAQIAKFTCNLVKENKENDDDIAKWLIGFNNMWMSKEQFQVSLNSNIFGNRALNYIFLTYCEHISNVQFSIDDLKKINSLNPNIEHILSQTPNFDPNALGFNDEEDYINYEHRIGNLTLLEKSLNSSVQNKAALDKVQTYDKSILIITKQVSTKITDIKGFTKKDLTDRTKIIAEYVSKKWWCEVSSLDDTLQYTEEDDEIDIV